jgi:lipopolysaccharide export system permease protein
MRIFFYILREYLKYVVGNIVLTVFLFVLFDFIHKTTKYFAEFNPKSEYIFRFYLTQIPSQIVQALPIASLLASVVSMVLLSRTNEITAMRASGMGPMQIGAPLALGGLILSIGSLLTSEFVLPGLAQKVRYVQDVLIEGRKEEDVGQSSKWLRLGQTLFSFKDFDPIGQRLWGISIIELRSNFRPFKTIEAEVGSFQSDSNKWRLGSVRTFHFRKNGSLDFIEPGTFLDVELPFEPKKLKRDDRKPAELSYRELRDAIERGDRSGIDTLPLKVEVQGKLAYPFAAFVVSLIGLKFGYKSERATETAKGVLIAFFIGISYWFVLSAGRALGLRGDINPIVSAWLPNVVVLAFVLIDSSIGRRLNA